MSEPEHITRICTDASLLIAEAFPGLTVMFFPYAYEEFSETLDQAKERVVSHPCYDQALRALSLIPKDSNNKGVISTGLLHANATGLSFLRKKADMLACIFVPHSHLRSVRHSLAILFSTAFSALYEIDNHKELIGFDYKKLSPQQQNFTADWYGAFAASFIKQRSFIEDVAHFRAKQCFKPQKHDRPEDYPTVLGYDAGTIIYQDHVSKSTPSLGFKYAFHSASEILHILTPELQESWRSFTDKTQNLAWSGAQQADILGMSIHTSEDGDIRAIASLLSSVLSVQSKLSTYSDIYNPFTTDDVNERHHIKLSRKKGKKLIAALLNNPNFNLNDAYHNEMVNFARGSSLGWVAYPLIQVSRTLENLNMQEPPASKAEKMHALQDSFDKALKNIPWSSILALHNEILKDKQDNLYLTHAAVIDMVNSLQVPNENVIKDAFSPYQDAQHITPYSDSPDLISYNLESEIKQL